MIIKKHDDTIEGLTPKELIERKNSEKEANIIYKEIIFTIKIILFISIIIILSLLISSIIKAL